MPPSPTSTSCHPRCARSSTQLPRSTSSPPPSLVGWPGSPMTSISFRHLADERLDTVLGHMHSIDAHASGCGGPWQRPDRRSPTPSREFRPDHILLALRSPEHANWQETRLIEHIEERFGLPLTTYAVDAARAHIARRRPAAALLRRIRGRQARHRTRRRPVRGPSRAGRDRPAAVRRHGHRCRVGRDGAAWSTSSRSNVHPPRPTAASPKRASRIAQEAGLDAEPVADRVHRPGVGDDRRASPTATTPRRSSWAPAD